MVRSLGRVAGSFTLHREQVKEVQFLARTRFSALSGRNQWEPHV